MTFECVVLFVTYCTCYVDMVGLLLWGYCHSNSLCTTNDIMINCYVTALTMHDNSYPLTRITRSSLRDTKVSLGYTVLCSECVCVCVMAPHDQAVF